MSLRLHTRLTLAIGALLVALAIVLAAAIARIAERYHAEIGQRLNAGVAMYVTDELSLLDAQGVNAPALQELARRVMTVNPSAEVYLLSHDGRILETLQPRERLARAYVGLAPIRRFLASPDDRPLYGDDPSDRQGHAVFSVAPIRLDRRLIGYLYVIFASERSESVAAAIRGSYSLQTGFIVAIAILLVTFVIAALLFGRLTLPLRTLEHEMRNWDRATIGHPHDDAEQRAAVDEITLLQERFRAMAARIESQLQELEARDTQRRDLVASVSHDLRTPLAALRGYLETIVMKGEALDAATRRQYLEVAQRHAQQLERLIAALFELSKLESGPTPAFEPFSLSDLLHDFALRFRLRAQQLGVELATSVEPSTSLAFGDVSLVERMLENLLDNSLQHTAAGGRVELSLSCADERAFRVAVSDSGSGIQPLDLPHVFERFYSGKSNRAGMGLGLAIVRRIAELHGASVSVSSTPQVGTRVEITLPVFASSAQTRGQTAGLAPR